MENCHGAKGKQKMLGISSYHQYPLTRNLCALWWFWGGFLCVPYVLGLSVFSYRQVWLFTAGSKAHLLAEGGGCLVPGSSRVTQTRLPRTFRCSLTLGKDLEEAAALAEDLEQETASVSCRTRRCAEPDHPHLLKIADGASFASAMRIWQERRTFCLCSPFLYKYVLDNIS